MIKRLIAFWLLLYAGFACLQRSDAAEWLPLAISGAAVNNTALDGAVNNSASASSVVLPGLTTTAAGIIIVFIENNSGALCTVTDTASLSYAQRGATSSSNLQEFFAISAAAHAGNVLTTGCAGTGFIEATAFGVKGVKTGTNNGFDSNGGLPVSALSGAMTISTSNANDYLYAGIRTGTITPASGFIQIGTGTFLLVEALNPHPTTTQTNLNIPDPGSQNGAIGDAVVSN